MDVDYEQEEMQSVLDLLEEGLRLDKYEAVDKWLSNANLDGLFPATIVGVLSLTFWGKERLKQRGEFLQRAERSLRTRLGDERAEALLIHRR